MTSTVALKALSRRLFGTIEALKDEIGCVPMDRQREDYLLLKRLEKISSRLDERITNRRLGEIMQALTQGYRSFD